MAKSKKIAYAEPASYFPKEIQKQFESEPAKKTTTTKKRVKRIGKK